MTRMRRSWPAPIAPAAFHGLAGEVVRAVEPHSEADPAALLVLTLAAFGNACGRGPGWEIGGTFHATNIFVIVVGRTSDGRKGTGWDAIKPVFARADREWARERVQSGLSSGDYLPQRIICSRDRCSHVLPASSGVMVLDSCT